MLTLCATPMYTMSLEDFISGTLLVNNLLLWPQAPTPPLVSYIQISPYGELPSLDFSQPKNLITRLRRGISPISPYRD